MPRKITIKAGDTEPLEFSVGATKLDNLDDVSAIVMYARKRKAAALHVDGAACSIVDSADLIVSFPVIDAKSGGGNAFDVEDSYQCHVKLTHTDGQVTRHPGKGFMIVDATEPLG